MKSFVVLGSGGVGKTTVAASLGLALTKEMGRVALFTVDPSLRLCQTLGLQKLSLEAAHLMEDRLEAYGLEIHEGLKRLLSKVIHDPMRLERIVRHRLFRVIEGNISHLDHFLAMEKIVELLDRRDLEFLVIDTPPHDQAFEFFESPKVLASFLDKAFLKILLDPASPIREGLVARLINKAVDEGWKIFRSVLGETFWKELAELLHDLLPLRERLLSAAERMNIFLRHQDTRSALVTVPEQGAFSVARTLKEDWKRKLGLDVATMVFNKAHPKELRLPDSLKGTLFYQRLMLQRNLETSDFFKSFQRVSYVSPRSPASLNIETLKEVGCDIIPCFVA